MKFYRNFHIYCRIWAKFGTWDLYVMLYEPIIMKIGSRLSYFSYGLK